MGPGWLELGAADHQLYSGASTHPTRRAAKEKISTEHAEGGKYFVQFETNTFCN